MLYSCSQGNKLDSQNASDSLSTHLEDTLNNAQTSDYSIDELSLYCPPKAPDIQRLILNDKVIQEIIQHSHSYNLVAYKDQNRKIIYNQGRALYLTSRTSQKTTKLADYLPESEQFSDPFWSYNKKHIAWIELSPQGIQVAVCKLDDLTTKYYPLNDIGYAPHESCKEKIVVDINYFDETLLDYKPKQVVREKILDHFTPDQLLDFTIDGRVQNIYTRSYLHDDHLKKSKNLIIYGQIYAASSSLLAYEIVDQNDKVLPMSEKVQKILHQENYYLWSPKLTPDAQMLVYAETDTLTNQLTIQTYNLESQEIKTLGSIPEISRRGLSVLLWSPSEQQFAFVDMPNNASQLTVLYLVKINTSEVTNYAVNINHHCGASCYCLAGEDFFFEDENTIAYRIPTAESRGQYNYVDLMNHN